MTDKQEEQEEALLKALQDVFQQALKLRRSGEVDKVLDLLTLILKREPRLAEPRLELAHLYLEMERWEDAEAEAKEAQRLLESGGQWLESLSTEQLMSQAHSLIGESLKSRMSSDEVVFGDPSEFEALLKESRHHFSEASRLDPENDYAQHVDMHLNLEL